MGESTTITHAILTIAAILIASLFASVIIGQLNTLFNSISISIKNRSEFYRLSISIVHASIDKVNNIVYIYAKNTGDVVYGDLNNIDFIVTDYSGKTSYYSTNPNATNRVNYVEYGSQPGVFEKGETVLFTIQLTDSYTLPLEVKLVLSSGYSTSYVVG
jgi:flagellar protein FlaG